MKLSGRFNRSLRKKKSIGHFDGGGLTLTFQRFLLILLCGLLLVGYKTGGWWGVYTMFLISGVLSVGMKKPGSKQQDENSETLERQRGELVPAKRGKPDPTRPTLDDNAGWITERKHRG